MTSEVTSKTCQNDIKLHTCGWFGMIFEDIQSDLPKEVRGQSWPWRSLQKTCQNDFKLHTCGWFEFDCTKYFYSPMWDRVNHIQMYFLQINCVIALQSWNLRYYRSKNSSSFTACCWVDSLKVGTLFNGQWICYKYKSG